MAGHRERKTAFVADKNAFASGTSARGEVPGKKAGQRKAAAHQPRDADFGDAPGQGGWTQGETSGHNVHKLEQGETSGHDVHKLGNGRAGQGSPRSATGKPAGEPGQAEKASQKRRQQRKFQKENSFVPDGKNQPGMDCGKQNLSVAESKAETVFLQEQNDFVEETDSFTENGNKGAVENTKGQRDGSGGRDAYRQSVKKNHYRRRQGMEHLKKARGSWEYAVKADSGERAGRAGFDEKSAQDGKHREKTDFERDFDVKDTVFTENAKEKAQGKGTSKKAEKKAEKSAKRTERVGKKAEKSAKRTERARGKLPKEKEYSFERVFDEKTGKTKYVLTAVEREKLFQTDNPVKVTAQKAVRAPVGIMHGKVAEAERENSAVEGAHKSEQKAEGAYRFVKRQHGGKAQRQRRKLEKLEKKQLRREVDFRYQKFLEENPELSEKTLKKQFQKRLQKRRIRREYAKAKRAGQTAKGMGQAAKGMDFAAKAARKATELAARHAPVLVGFGALALLFVVLMSSLSSCGALFSEGISAVMAGSYQSRPEEIDAADLAFSKLELELQKEIDSVETDYPGYDEYRYNLGAIGHDPFALISYLSAVHTEFTAADVQGELESLFDAVYALNLNPTEETRTRTVTKTGTRTVTKTGTRTVTKTGTRTVTDPETGEETEEEYEYEEEEEYEYEEEEEYEYEEEEEYTVSILEVTLTVKDLGVVAAGRMDAGQKEVYELYNETHGLLQRFYTPLDLYWYNYISSYYGWRTEPATGAEQMHRGLDIAVPTGTPVLAAMDGIVTTAAYDSYYGNYVVIEDAGGYCTKYAHMDTLNVRAGQDVTHGTKIGTTGNTGSSAGSHLHIECLFNGEYFNPLFYFEAGEGTLYGETQGAGSGGGNAIPPDSYDDEAVRALMEEAAKYLGYPYVWGGSNPSTSFDCSGFVCWVFTNSGVHNLPRTTAQGIYDQCTPVSAADAKAGDIIFFTGTYNSAGAVSHVGIYCGNGVMIHCGDPIKYASINTPYWQSHFYAFARLN